MKKALPLKIWSTEELTKITDVDQLFVKLEAIGERSILLCVCDKSGERIEAGSLLSLDQDNINGLILMSNISDVVPLKTDLDGELLYMCHHEYENHMKAELTIKVLSDMSRKVQEEESKAQQEVIKH